MNNISKIGSYELINSEDGIFYVDYFTGEILFSENKDDFCENIKENLKIENSINNNLVMSRFDNMLKIYNDICENNKLLHLIIIPTYNCNFDCSYCYEHKNSFFMKKETVNSIKLHIKNNIEFYDSIFIEWFGGEPLLAISYIEEVMSFVKSENKENKKIYSHITTNGSLLSLENAKKLYDLGVDSYTVTIDGFLEYHDKYRFFKGGKPSYLVIIRNLLSIYNSDLPINIKLRCNMTKFNLSGIEKLLLEWIKMFKCDNRFSDIDIREVSNYTNCVSKVSDLLSKDESNNMKFNLLKKFSKLGLFDKSLWNYTEVGSCICYASEKNSYIIDPYSNILKCTIVLNQDDRNIVGYLDKNGKVIYNEKLDYWINVTNRNNSKCNNCPKLLTCFNSSCPLALINHNKHDISSVCPDFCTNISSFLGIMKDSL